MLDLEGGAMAVLGGSSSGDGKDEQPVYTARIGDTVAVFQGLVSWLSLASMLAALTTCMYLLWLDLHLMALVSHRSLIHGHP
jgi:hypothetical protein